MPRARLSWIVTCLTLALAASAAAQTPSTTYAALTPAHHPALPSLALAPLPALPYALAPAPAQSGDAPETLDFPACPDVTAAIDGGDSGWQWRLRAYRQLDCVRTIVETALDSRTRTAAEGDEAGATVTLSRDDLERIRLLAWWARDAAARIER